MTPRRGTRCKPWRDAARPGLPGWHIHECIQETVQGFPASVWGGADAAVVVLRGGALMESALTSKVPVVGRVWASRQGGSPILAETPRIDTEVRRLLVCDVLADTGATLAACSQWARQAAPRAEVRLVCIYTTDLARGRLERLHQLYCAAEFGRSDWEARGPAAIPYDFGEVALECGLV